MTVTEKWFLFSAIAFGILFGIFVPPFQAPDEVHHLYRTVHVSRGHLIAEQTPDSRMGGNLPIHYQKISDPFLRLRYNKNTKTNFNEIKKTLSLPINVEQTEFLDFPNVGYYSAINYMPQALIRFLISPLNINGIYELYILRILSISIWILVLGLCVKICPKLKVLWLLAGTLPAALFTHAGLSTDLLTHTMAFLAIAIFFRMYFSKIYSYRDWILFSLLCLVLIYNRIVFAPLILFGFMLNTSIFQSKKHYWSLNTINILLTLFIIGSQFILLGDSFIPYDQYNPLFREGKQLNPGVDPIGQLNFIFDEPIKFLGILMASWFEIFPHTLAHYLGKFGWEANYIPRFLIFLLGLALIIQVVTIKISFTIPTRLKIAGVGILCSLALSLILYMQWEKVGALQITSLSGRYFVGIFPIFFISIVGVYPMKLKINLALVIWIIAWIVSLFCVFNRYYW